MINLVGLIVPALIALAVIILLASGYTKAPPDMAYIISGVRKKPRILIGQAGIKIPFFERLDKLSLGAIQIDVKTKTAVPTAEYINVRVDSTVAVRVGRSDEMIALAAQNFLNINRDTIGAKINDLLEGNVREIVGQMKLTEMVSDRKAFSDKVQANVVPDLAKFGLELVSFNVQNFSDEGGVIDNLGIDNVEQIRKGAAIAKSNAQREIAVAEAENDKAANDAKVKAATEIAKKQTEFAVEKAAMQEQADTAQAKADAAKAIEAEHQRKEHEIAVANANLARQEKEIELKEREVAITERKLEAEIKKKADADKYAAQQVADAKAYAAQKAAEADLYEREKLAEAARIEAEKKAAADLALATAEAEAKKALAAAIKAQGEAEAAAEQAKGLAEAEAIRAKAEAEAKGMLEKAEALKQYGDAAKQQMELDAVKVLYEQLPAIAEAIGKGYAGADIHLIGNDSGQLAGNMMGNMTQIIEGFRGATGVDPMSIISGMLGAKLADNQ
jgi:flotillin